VVRLHYRISAKRLKSKQNNFTGQKYKKAATNGSLIQHVLYSSVTLGILYIVCIHLQTRMAIQTTELKYENNGKEKIINFYFLTSQISLQAPCCFDSLAFILTLKQNNRRKKQITGVWSQIYMGYHVHIGLLAW